MGIEIPVREALEIPEGRHNGVIIKVEERKYEKYSYIDIHFSVDGKYEIRYGCPATITKGSKLGKLIANFTEIKPGETLDVEKILVGKKVELMTINEVTEDGTFARVVDGSVKPLRETEKAVCLCGFMLEGNEKFCPSCGAKLM